MCVQLFYDQYKIVGFRRTIFCQKIYKVCGLKGNLLEYISIPKSGNIGHINSLNLGGLNKLFKDLADILILAIWWSLKLCLRLLCGAKSVWVPSMCGIKSALLPSMYGAKTANFSPYMDGSNSDFAPHIEGIHADFAPYMERRYN